MHLMPWHTHRASHICISLHCGTTSDLPKLTLKVQCVYWLWTFVLTQLKVNTTLVNLPVCCLAASSISLPIFQRFVTASILGAGCQRGWWHNSPRDHLWPHPGDVRSHLLNCHQASHQEGSIDVGVFGFVSIAEKGKLSLLRCPKSLAYEPPKRPSL